MVKKKHGWFTYVKKVFISEAKSNTDESDQRQKRWRWRWGLSLASLKLRHHPISSIEPPQRRIEEDEGANEGRKHAVALAIAAAAAAEAAVAAADAAAEVVKLTNVAQKFERKRQQLAAMKIQTAYRGYLARKALSALKGIVKLQAVVRGELARSIDKKIESMSPFSVSQVQDHTRMPLHSIDHWEKMYNLSQRERLTEHEQPKVQDRRNGQILMQLIDKAGYTEPVYTSRLAQLWLGPTRKLTIDEASASHFSLSRKSMNQLKGGPFGEDRSFPMSPVSPAYMAATESAKAKCRSLSAPRQRLKSHNASSDHHNPRKLDFSSWNSTKRGVAHAGKRNDISRRLSENFEAFQRD